MLVCYLAMIDREEDAQRFSGLYFAYQKQMLQVALGVLRNQEDAEDAVQTALLCLAQHIRDLPTEEKPLRAYVLVAARNAALSMLRSKKKEGTQISLEDLPLAAAEDDLFQKVVRSQDYALLLRSIRQLDPRYRDVLMLLHVQGLSIREAAAVLHRRPKTVRQQANRAKRLLLKICQKEGLCLDEAERNDAV